MITQIAFRYHKYVILGLEYKHRESDTFLMNSDITASWILENEWLDFGKWVIAFSKVNLICK